MNIEKLQKQAENGDPQSLYELAVHNIHGPFPERNLSEAFRLMQQAAELGYPDAINGLGACYLEGTGVE
ncbi:MAG: hypothetical protein FWC50_06220, partial [Planctomycetaceae bacterium]|nr:hypothetical protein [Planctomycetaceae bacterium]